PDLVVAYTGTPASKLAIDPHPPWLDATIIPSSIEEKAQELGISITLSQWESLAPVQRFALIKLSRPSHENKNFLPALQEFGLVRIEN
ncbi:MAG: nitrate reductase associated protein, partial [Symploca sp. SIO3E6]|nr:nitrate reductase associated protein [Caldora sp. SIO3E6]